MINSKKINRDGEWTDDKSPRPPMRTNEKKIKWVGGSTISYHKDTQPAFLDNSILGWGYDCGPKGGVTLDYGPKGDARTGCTIDCPSGDRANYPVRLGIFVGGILEGGWEVDRWYKLEGPLSRPLETGGSTDSAVKSSKTKTWGREILIASALEAVFSGGGTINKYPTDKGSQVAINGPEIDIMYPSEKWRPR